MTQGLVDAVERYYTQRVQEHGPTPQGVDWNGAHSQEVRFRQLLGALPERDGELSILDYGCGYGALVDSLTQVREQFRYQGYDVSQSMVDEAKRRYASEPRASFTTRADELRPADVTLASGIFNVKLDATAQEWLRYVYETIAQMVRLSTHGLAFNALTSHSDHDRMRPHLYYTDPGEMLDHCLRTYSRDVSLRHDYELYEFTIAIRLDGRPPAGGPKLPA